MSTTRDTLRPFARSALFVLLTISFLPHRAGPAHADGFAEALAGCWVDEAGENMSLQPSESYMYAGDLGRWSAGADSLTLRPGRNRSIEWSLALEDGVMTLSSPEESRREGARGEPVDPSSQLVFRRSDWSDCNTQPLFEMPYMPEPPSRFQLSPPSLLLTNRLRNDPIEIRLADSSVPVVCEIVEGVCQSLSAEALVFDETAPGLLPAELGGTARVQIWKVTGSGGEAADHVGATALDGTPCVAGEGSCEASSGHLVLMSPPGSAPITGLVVLGSDRDPAYERAFVSPSAGSVPPLLWIEAVRRFRGGGEHVWTAFRVVISEVTSDGDTAPRLQVVAGPFQTGALTPEMPRRLDDGRRQHCESVARSEPVIDATDGSVSVTGFVSLDPPGGRRLELAWNESLGRYEALTSMAGASIQTESVCEEPQAAE